MGTILGGVQIVSAANGKDLISGRELSTGEQITRGIFGTVGVLGGLSGLNAFSQNTAFVRGTEPGTLNHYGEMAKHFSRAKYTELNHTAQVMRSMQHTTVTQLINTPDEITIVDDTSWSLNKKGAIINGRKYTGHSLERMAPDTPAVRAQLNTRAQYLANNRGLKHGTEAYYKFIKNYVQPRNIPPSVIEDAIANGTRSLGNTSGTWIVETNDLRVIINSSGDVITVISK